MPALTSFTRQAFHSAFAVIHEFETKNYYELEQALHKLLDPYRINRSREFFTDGCLAYIEQIVAVHQGIQSKA